MAKKKKTLKKQVVVGSSGPGKNAVTPAIGKAKKKSAKQELYKHIKILIDTNSYYAQKFDFASFPIQAALKYCQGYGISILVPNVQSMEIRKKIKDYSNTIETKHLSNIRKIWLYKRTPNLIDGFLQKELLNSFESFLQESVVIECDIKDIEINSIVKRYCECRPPFTRKKPKEFMDAFMLISALDTGKNLLVISKDDGMKDFAKENSCRVFDDITSMLNYLFTSNKLRPSYLSQKAMEIWPNIEAEIKQKLKSLYVYADDIVDCDLVIDEVELKPEVNVNLVSINDSIFTIAYFVDANHRVTGTYVDEECGIYDSEDEVFIPFDSKEYDDWHNVTGYVTAEITISPKNLSVSYSKLVDTKPIELETISINNDYY